MSENDFLPIEQVRRALEMLCVALSPFIHETMTRLSGPKWKAGLRRRAGGYAFERDVAVALQLIINNYPSVFLQVFHDDEPLHLAHRAKQLRHHVSHGGEVDEDYAQASLFFLIRLAKYVGGVKQADEISALRNRLMAGLAKTSQSTLDDSKRKFEDARSPEFDELEAKRILNKEAQVYAIADDRFRIDTSSQTFCSLRLSRTEDILFEFVTPDLVVHFGFNEILSRVSHSPLVEEIGNPVLHSFICANKGMESLGHTSLTNKQRYQYHKLSDLFKQANQIKRDLDGVIPDFNLREAAFSIMASCLKDLRGGKLVSCSLCIDPKSKELIQISSPIDQVLRVCRAMNFSREDCLKATVSIPKTWLSHDQYVQPLQTVLCGAPILCGTGNDCYIGFVWCINCDLLVPNLKNLEPENILTSNTLQGRLRMFELIRRKMVIEPELITTLGRLLKWL